MGKIIMAEKVCLIIGGGRGMGAATARQMHSRDLQTGFNVAF